MTDLYELKKDFEYAFECLVEFHVRTEKKWHRDKIYRGVFHKTLIKEGFLQRDIELAKTNGFIIENKIKYDDGSQRISYLCLTKEMPQREKLKRIFDKIYRLIRGEYSEYYGKE